MYTLAGARRGSASLSEMAIRSNERNPISDKMLFEPAKMQRGLSSDIGLWGKLLSSELGVPRVSPTWADVKIVDDCVRTRE